MNLESAASNRARLSERLSHNTMASIFLATAREYGSKIAVRSSDDRMRLTYFELLALAQRIGAGLKAVGLRPRQTLALMLRNRPEFHAVDLAAMCLGATSFSLYNTSSPQQLGHMLRDAASAVVVCETRFLSLILESRQFGASFETVVVIDGEGYDGTMSLKQLIAAGKDEYDLDHSVSEIAPDDILTLIYTSGSTGLPKGVELTHRNLVAQVRAIDATVSQESNGPCVSFMPAAHIGDRGRWYYGAILTFGHEVTTIADAADLTNVWKSVRPIFCSGVPRIWEKVRTQIEATYGANVGERALRDAGLGEEIRSNLGLDRVRWFTTGSAPTHPDQFTFFSSIGINLCELWGMTETCALAVTNTPTALRFGSVGKPMGDLQLQVASDGELLVRGPTISTTYRNRPDATAEALNEDGWLRTGDIARVDEDGFWWITGRKKDVIINAAGKNMSPANIESALKSSGRLISQACVIGDRRPFNVALLVIDSSVLGSRDLKSPEVLGEVQSCVDKANSQLSRVEQIKRFAILSEEWLVGGDELTATMKLKRREIAEKYSLTIDGLYG